MANSRNSLTPLPLLQDTDYVRNSRRFPPMAPPPTPPPFADPRAPGYPTNPSMITPGGSIRPEARLPYPDFLYSATPSGPIRPYPRVFFPARSASASTPDWDGVETFDDITDKAKDYGKQIVERAEMDAKLIEEQIQKLRDETDARIKELEDAFKLNISVAQENAKRLRALVTTQKATLGLMEKWEEDDEKEFL